MLSGRSLDRLAVESLIVEGFSWHIFPHSFLSAPASKGVGQRIIDDLAGHSTEEQRRRYCHLFPDPVGTGV